METTWSLSSRLPMSILSIWRFIRLLELETALAGGVGEGLDAAVVLEAAAVEDHGLDALFPGARRDQLADRLGGGDVRAPLGVLLQGLVQGRGRAHRLPAAVVDHLGVDVRLAAEHREPRPLGRAGDLLADAPVDASADVFFCLHV